MAIETHQLYSAAGDALGAKQAAAILNVGVQHFYKLAADPMSLDVPVRDDVMRITQLVEAMTARPHAKAKLHLWRLYFDDLFRRAVDRDEATPLDCETIREKAAALCQHFGELLAECGPGFNPDRIANEGAEVIAAITTLVRCAELTDDMSRTAKVRTLKPAS